MTTQPPPRPRRWLKRFVILAVLLALVLVAGYFFISSSTFLELVVLPKVSRSLQAEVTVRDASISPFSQVVLRDLQVHTTGTTPLLTSREVRARYNLRQILGGTIVIDEVTLQEPRLHVVFRADGTSNLDPLLKAGSSEDKESESPDTQDEPAQIQLRQAALHQAQAQVLRELPAGGQESFSLSNLNLTVTNVRNDGSGTFALNMGFLWRSDPTEPATNGLVAGGVEGRFTFDLNKQLQPVRVQGRTDLAVQQAEGALIHADQLRGAIEAQVTPSEIRQLRLSFDRLGNNFGQVEVSGPFDFDRQEGDLKIVAGSIDHHLLNLLGASYGLEFGPDVSLRSTNQVRIGPEEIRISGQTSLENLSVTAGSNSLAQGAVHLRLAGQVRDQSQSLQSTLVLSNLTGHIDQHRLTNVTVSSSLDVSNYQQVAEIRLLQLTLPATERAANQLNVTGRLDLSDAAGPDGQLSIRADSLDLTPFYPPPAAAPPESGEPQTAPPPGEPDETTRLPVKQLIAEITVGQFFLRDLQISNWLTRLEVGPEKVRIDPARFTVNGAPVNLQAELSLGVPGYGYDLACTADAVPLEPLANTFLDVPPGSYKGNLIAQIQLRGAGTTGPSLRRTLQGTAAVAFTNAEVQLVSPFFQRFLAPIALLIGVPDLLTTPLNHVLLQAAADQGKIRVEQCQLQSSLFRAETQGTAAIADELLNSAISGWPMRFALRRGLAERIKLASEQTRDQSGYVALPDFVRVEGTLSEPVPKLDARALATAGLQQLADKVPEIQQLNEKTGGILQQILGGQSDTNAPGTKPFNPLDLFKKRE